MQSHLDINSRIDFSGIENNGFREWGGGVKEIMDILGGNYTMGSLITHAGGCTVWQSMLDTDTRV